MSFCCEGRSDTLVPVHIQDLEDIALNWAVAFSLDMTNIYDFVSHFPRVRDVQYDEGGETFLSAGWNRSHPDGPYHWEPLSNWSQLGELIDKYGLTWQWTARDHECERVSAFCPGSFNKGWAYGRDCKTAMLRALVNHLQASDMIEIPIDLLRVSKTFVEPDTKALFSEFPKEPEIVHEHVELDNNF